MYEKVSIVPGAPMVIALVLGPMLEYALYQALGVAHGDVTTFITRPISAHCWGSLPSWPCSLYKTVRMKRTVTEDEEEKLGPSIKK